MGLLAAFSLIAILAASSGPAAPSDPSAIPEENYGFLSVKESPCVPRFGVRIESKHKTECEQMTEPRRYRGTWVVGFETSLFTPIGQQDCIETKGRTECAVLKGKTLPWPSQWACPRKYKVEFIGRRNLMPGFDPTYTIIVDEVISTKPLPSPHKPADCDAAAP